MMIASIMAWPGAIAIGVSLGLLGSGGSILTVPVLVYLIGQDEKVAIAGSLFIVGSIALTGSLQFLRDGLVIGVITGLVGVGGGFLIVPALVLLGGLSMHRAVATSLVIIALKSYSGFYKYLDVLREQGLELDWPTLGLVTLLGIGGSFLGSHLAKRAPQAKLKRWFGYFLIVMGLYILARSAPTALGLAS